MTEDKKKYEELIEKHAQRDMAIKEVSEDYIQEEQILTKQISVKIFPNTHKTLKLIAAAKDTTLERIASSIVKAKVGNLDIVEYVREAVENPDEFEDGFYLLRREDIDKSAYDLNDKLLNKGNPRKRINVKVDLDTHRKLRIVSAIQDRSLDKIVCSIIEYEVGEKNQIDTSELMDEILNSMNE